MLEDGASPPQPLLYSLSTAELETLWEFLNKHLNIGFCKGNLSVAVESHTVLAEGKSKVRYCLGRYNKLTISPSRGEIRREKSKDSPTARELLYTRCHDYLTLIELAINNSRP